MQKFLVMVQEVDERGRTERTIPLHDFAKVMKHAEEEHEKELKEQEKREKEEKVEQERLEKENKERVEKFEKEKEKHATVKK